MAGRAQQQQNFYRPYDSADESGADSDTESSQTFFNFGINQEPAPKGTVDGHPNFKEFASQSQLMDAAGPNLSTLKDQLSYGEDRLGKHTTYSYYEGKPGEEEDPYASTEITTADGTDQTLVLIDSRYRDRTAYPQPTLFTLRLPRIYKNITNITLADVKLLTSFYFFRLTKGNTDITVYEKGRQTLTYEGTYQSTIVKRYITTGSYSIDSLQAEVQLQLNYTPLFFDFVNGFGDFLTAFRASGDFSINFNFPGDYFFNNTTNLWVPNPTVNTIVSHFWKNRFAGLSSYTTNQALLAYYYPVLNEYLFDDDYSNSTINLTVGLGIDPTITTIPEVINRILYNFQGINPPDTVVFAVVNANKPILDKYRLEHTFRYWLINKYIVGRDTRSQNVYITTPSLNTSLVNLLNTQRQRFFTKALQEYGITLAQYNSIEGQVDRSLAVLSDMYNFHQTRFLDYFAVPWSQYTLSYYANLNYQIFLRPGLNTTDVPANDPEAVSAGIISYSNDVLSELTTNPPYYWPNMSNLSAGLSTISLVNLSSATSSYQEVYHLSLSNFFPSTNIVDPISSYIYSEYLTNSANAVCPIQSGKYTVFKFHSPVRQTMQVETLPRPPAYRLPTYNQANFDSNINYYFDLSYAYVFTSNSPYPPSKPSYLMAYDNLPSTNLIQIPGWSPADGVAGANFGQSYLSSLSSYTSNLTTDVLKFNRSLYMTFTTPEFPGADPNSNYTFAMNLSVQFYSTNTSMSTATPAQQCRMFLYHDRGGFEGDVSGNRNESPYFWKFSTVITPQMSTATIQFTSYPKQQYFVCLRPDVTNFGNVYTRIAPWFSDPIVSTVQTRSIAGINPATDIYLPNFNNLITSNFNYAQVYDSNFIRLPIASTLWAPDPSSNTNNSYLPLNLVPIGYDSNNASTDYTDYIPYTAGSFTFSFYPTSNFGIDPISQYFFQSNSAYNLSTQTFLFAGGSNSMFTPGVKDVYNPGIVPTRQFKIANYYSVNYLPESDSNIPLAPGLIGNISTAQLPYTVSTTQGVPIGGYTYGTNSNIQLSRGVLGWNFIPDEGVWDVKSVVFRSAIEDYANDPNSNIKYLAVYNMGDIISTNTVNLTMSTAYVVLSNSSRVTYTSTFTVNTDGFDVKGGTWYEFIKDTSFVAQTYSNVLGYTQTIKTMSDQPESMYCVIAFNQYGTPITIKALSGSAVPYPFYSQVFQGPTYLDGTSAYNTGKNVVFPSSIGQTNWPFATSLSSFFGPPPGGDVSQSKYSLSQPIGTSVVNFKRGIPATQDSNYIYPWTTTLTPTKVLASVAEYMLLQDVNFNIYEYSLIQASRTFGTPKWEISPDQVFPSYEVTSLVGIAANTTHFYFMGFSNDGGLNIDYALRMKRFDPTTGVLFDYPLDSSFKVPIGGTFKSFTINDAEQIVFSYQQTNNSNYLYRCLLASTSMTSMGSLPVASTLVHAMDAQSSTIYMLPQNGGTGQGTQVFRLNINGPFPGTPYTPTVVGPPGPPSWTGLTVNKASTVPSPDDRIFLYSEQAGYESNVYVTSNWGPTLSTFNMVLVSTPVLNLAGAGQAIGGLMNGYNAGLWITTTQQPLVWGNRNSETDVAGIIDSAWQIFYPTQKIVLEKLANQYNPMVDLTYLDYPEYPHTAMFYYPNGTKMSNDIDRKWGLESKSNFLVSDTTMSGYYFNSYVYNVPLVASSGADYQYLTVRGYSPTETSETMIRFNLPNKYDFGYASQLDIINEITLLSAIPGMFNSNYAYTISTFNISYQQSNSYFGNGLLPDFEGSNFNSSNFQQFASNYSTIYAGYQSNAALLTNIQNFVNSNLLQYISTNLQYILPADALGRLNFTDPVVFSLLWKSGLLPQYKNLLEDWGLGYNLGYAKLDTPFSTYARAISFYKIFEDYIYLRMNPEYQLNRMDSTARENLSITRDSTGSIQNFHGKLILNNFNSFSTSFVFNNNPFNPPIGRLDTMYFEWVDFTGLQIDNADCEWTASLIITESKSKASLPVRMKAPQALLPPFMKPYTNPKK